MEKKHYKTKNNVEKVFEELKLKGLISKNIKLKSTFWTLNFQAGLFSRNVIKYNPKFSNLKEDVIRFILLHEVGHHTTGSISKELIGAIVSFLVGLYLTISFSNFLGIDIANINIFETCFITVLFFYLFFSIFRLLVPWMKKEEFDADLWAMKQLIKHYNIREPVKFIKFVFKEFERASQRINIETKPSILTKFLNFLEEILTYHPSHYERILNVEMYFMKER